MQIIDVVTVPSLSRARTFHLRSEDVHDVKPAQADCGHPKKSKLQAFSEHFVHKPNIYGGGCTKRKTCGLKFNSSGFLQ